MADFRQLALEFVLADDEAKKTSLSQQAATELKTASAASKPVARWVEAVHPWMPGSGGDETMADGDTPDWAARAKALEFLSRTLDFMDKNVLGKSQVQLLVGFFGAMFDIDHKAGVMASATALSNIVAMDSFQSSNANDIIRNVCALRDDFGRQLSKTRLAIYKLLQTLLTLPSVSSDLKTKQGSSAAWMKDLLELCRSERDPDCLMVWFGIQKHFLTQYSPSQEMIEAVYNVFKAYFPISLPRASQSGLTPEDLKLSLRACFSASHQVAHLAFPFLLSKLDQGEGVTVNVKVDVLRTIKACIDSFDKPDESIVPYINDIWGNLKYEVRNGEIEDTIWATLEVLKTLASRLRDDHLRDYSLMVTRDCVSDLSNTTYTAPVGRLLVSVLSAGPTAFVLMVSPAIIHLKENLRHPKTPGHSQDLLKLLHVILETRLLLCRSVMTPQERNDFAAVDPIFKSLWDDVLKKSVEVGAQANASYEDLKHASEAVQGAGALACQRVVSVEASAGNVPHLLPDETCARICEALFNTFSVSLRGDEPSHKGASDELLNETSIALQRAVLSYTKGFSALVEKGMELIRSAWKTEGVSSARSIQTLSLFLAFVGCSALGETSDTSNLSPAINNFLYLSQSLHFEIISVIDAKADPMVWSALAAGLQSSIRHFNDACLQTRTDSTDGRSWDSCWMTSIKSKYPVLERADTSNWVQPETPASVAELRVDALLSSLYISRQLYRRATKPTQKGDIKALELSDDFKADSVSGHKYLDLISGLAGYAVHELGEKYQLHLQAQNLAIKLFREDHIDNNVISTASKQEGGLDWLASGKINVLSIGILEALHPSAVAELVSTEAAQQVIVSGLRQSEEQESSTSSITRSMLTILANKYKIETIEPLMKIINTLCEDTSNGNEVDASKAAALFAIAAGMLRRAFGSQHASPLLGLLREAPKHGQGLARRLEIVFAPQRYLTKENYATVKPLWMQRVYMELVQPLLESAIGARPEVTDPLAKTNFSVAVLLAIKHMPYTIYEDDAEKVLRVAIGVAQNISTGPDRQAALAVLKNVFTESPEKGQSHIRSIINICTNTFSLDASAAAPEWLPADYAPAGDSETKAACGRLALELLGGLPKLFETRHLLAYAPMVQKKLMFACGLGVRELRRTARLARAAWAELK